MGVTRAELQATLRSKGVKGQLSKMKKAELQAMLEANTAPGQAPEQEGRGAPARKRKRGKTAYNEFVGKWMKENKTNDMRAAVKAWKEQKGSGAPAAQKGEGAPSKKAAQKGGGAPAEQEGEGAPAAQEGAGAGAPQGFHRMADGSLMADDSPAIDMQTGEGESAGAADEQRGAGGWDDFKNYWAKPDREDHHEFFLNLAQQGVDLLDGQQRNWKDLLPTDDSESGGLVDGALLALMPGIGEAADAGLEGAEAAKAATASRSVFAAGRGAMRDSLDVRKAALRAGQDIGPRGSYDGMKTYGRAAGGQLKQNVKNVGGPVAPAVAEHFIDGGGDSGGGGGPNDGGPPNPLIGQAQRYAAYSASADQLNPFA